MAKTEIHAELRDVTGKQVRRPRDEGWVPAVLYGAGVESRALKIQTVDAEEMVRRAGTSRLITVHVDDGDEPVQAVIRDLQRDSIRRNLLHLDLYQVQMTKSITVELPILLVGESPVAKEREGILLQGAQSIEIECLPGDLIDAVEVDLSQLVEIDQQINIGDLALPSSITVLSDLDEMVARLNPLEEIPEEEEEEEEALEFEEFEDVEPELVGRGEEEEEVEFEEEA